jgi:hypothetical protein
MKPFVAATLAALAALAGCQAPEQVQRQPLPPLIEDGTPRRYTDLLDRVRYQASYATEAFYKNRWVEVEDTARGLEQSARLLARSEEVPGRQKETLAVVTADLGKEAKQLLDAAHNKDAAAVNGALQRLNLKVRALRLEE